MNFLTLKKMHQIEKKMEDFTVCFRFNLLSYRGASKTSKVVLANTDKRITDTKTQRARNMGFLYELNVNDGPGNGAINMKTFNNKMGDVLQNGGAFTIWPIYDDDVNANEWNSICLGSNIRDRNIFLARNGKTQHNISQPQVWADVNVGLDTSAVGPFQVYIVEFLVKFFFIK